MFKGHIAVIAPMDAGWFMLRGFNYNLRNVIKNTESCQLLEDGTIRFKGMLK